MHLTSLPGPFGSGDLGAEAYRFAEFLHAAGQRYWQILPVNPPAGGESPYQTVSSFAGHPNLVALDTLIEEGLLSRTEVMREAPDADTSRIDFPVVGRFRETMLRRAFASFRHRHGKERSHEFDAFVRDEARWLEDYALFVALKQRFSDRPWTQWDEPFRRREPAALKQAASELSDEMEYLRFVQFQFALHFRRLRDACTEKGIGLIGDVPIFVAHDSADVWANPEIFYLREDGSPAAVAGVPPDAFSDTGQRWGNALYRWEVLREHGYSWWIDRMRVSVARFDAVRLDHFIGFVRYWEIPTESHDARNGVFRPGPGRHFFDALRAALGDVQLIAEDLGILTDDVHALRDGLALPGMRVLQFVFGPDAGSRAFQPHAFPQRCVVYTGTHDNDTTLGWFQDPRAEHDHYLRQSQEFAKRYTRSDGLTPHWDMIHCAMASVANTAIVPMQDVLGLGHAARMNTPGTVDGNWSWRMRWEEIADDTASRLHGLSETYARIP